MSAHMIALPKTHVCVYQISEICNYNIADVSTLVELNKRYTFLFTPKSTCREYTSNAMTILGHGIVHRTHGLART